MSRVFREFVIPVVGAAVYGAIVGYAKQSPLDGVSAGGVAFLCLFALLGQILRAPKSASRRDSRPAATAETADDLISIQRGIEELKKQGALKAADPEKPESGQKMLFRNLSRSPARAPVGALAPRQLLDLKMPYQAVLNAAVNFEREVRRRAGLPAGRTVPLVQLFARPQFNLSKEKIEQLDTLRRIRISIVHGFETLVDPLEAEQLVTAYDTAASWFGPPKGGH